MAIDLSGREAQIRAASVSITVSENHPLIILAGVLPWPSMIDAIAEDLKMTTKKGCWWRGRKIIVRIHTAALLPLQVLMKKSCLIITTC